MLVMSRSFPPAVTGSSILMGNLAKQFSRDEMEIVGALDPGAPTVQWSKSWPRINYVIRWSASWRGERWLRLLYTPWLFIYTLAVLLLRRCQAVMVVYPDEYYLLTSYLVARLTRKPLYGYFHNTYLEKFKTSRLANWLQPRFFAYASHIFVMSEGMERLYRQNYPDLDCSPLKHTFNDPMPPDEPPPPLHDPIRLCLSGTINPASEDSVLRCSQMIREMDRVQFNLFTGTPQSYVERVGFTGPKVTVNKVSRDELLERIRVSDILLLPHGFTSSWAQEEIQTIFPTKTIEYLLSGRPILAHLPADCFLGEFLRRHECALIVDEPSTDALRQGLQTLIDNADLRADLVHKALKAAEQFQAQTVAQYLRDVVTQHSS